MNSRLKEIDDLVESVKPKKDYKKQLKNKIETYKNKYSKELEDYQYVNSKDELFNLKSGGYIRYVDYNGKLKFGGILLKVFNSENDNEIYKRTLILVQNSSGKKWTLSWEKNHVFYKIQTKKGDNLRNLFISLLDKKIE